MTNLVMAVNHDTQDQPYGATGVDWVDINLANDKVIFSNGLAGVVEDGATIPSESDLNSAGVVLTIPGTEIIVPKYFLEDISANELKEVFNMGNTNKRYVMAFDFDGATASEPRLELWDNINLNTVNLVSLGRGSPSSSFWRGIVTTNGLPGADWTGVRLAGASTGNFLWLNDQAGALTGATTLYCNLKVIIPATLTEGALQQPIIAVKYTSN